MVIHKKTHISRDKLFDIKTIVVLLLIGVILSAFFPSIITSPSSYRTVKMGVYVILAYLAYLTSIFKAFKNRKIQTICFVVLIAALQLLLFHALGFNIHWQDVIILFIMIMLVSIGYQYDGDENQIELIVLFYAIMSIVLGLSTMFFFVGSVTLSDYVYLVEAKNQTGQIMASCAAGLLVLTFSKKNNHILKYILLGLAVVLLVVIRCRTALIAFILFGLYYYYKTHNAKSIVLVVWAFIFVFLLFSSTFIDFFYDIFITDNDITDINAVSTGRMERNVAGLQFWASHPILGEMKYESGVPNIHNFLIHRLVSYGFFSFPFFLIFFYLLFTLINKWRSINSTDVRGVGYWILFIPFFCSLLEPSAPFGPGLVQAIPFFLFGVSLKKI